MLEHPHFSDTSTKVYFNDSKTREHCVADNIAGWQAYSTVGRIWLISEKDDFRKSGFSLQMRIFFFL